MMLAGAEQNGNHVSVPHVRTAIFTPVACFCPEQRSKSAVNKTQVIKDCLPRRGVIVCPDGGLASPKSVACENTGCYNIPLLIKIVFSP